MTEFRGISSGKTVTTKNNMNNVKIGDKIEVTEDNDKNKIVGIVYDICHLVSKWRNHQGLERSTHDIIIDIDDKGDNSRPQKQWKPSEGQLECLGYAIEKAEKDWSPLTNNRVYLTLNELKKQLEKL